MAEEPRRWFTFTDMLVAGFVLFLLFMLAATAWFHEPSRRTRVTQCMNNLRQLAIAQVSTVANQRSEFGSYLEPQRVIDDAAYPDEDSSTPEREIIVAWPTKLLPTIEQMTLYEQVLSGNEGLDLDAPPMMEIFRCPSDPQSDPSSASLSYVVNSGMPDLAVVGPNQPSDLKANGVFHDSRPGRFGLRVGMTDIKDGNGTTILLSENIHRDPPGSAKLPGNTWLRPASGAANPEQWYGMVWVVDPQSPRSPHASLTERFNQDTRLESELDQPYAASGTRFARPASDHPDVFVAAFCAGNTREIRDIIDYAVYQQLMTPFGAKAAPANAPNQPYETTLPADQCFMTPPLTDADY